MPHMPQAECENILVGHRKPVENDFHIVLGKLRGIFDWSKTEAGRRAGISPSLYSRYESGEVEPTLSNILKLMGAFGVDFATLIGEKKLRILPSDESHAKRA
mgnify:FL=1